MVHGDRRHAGMTDTGGHDERERIEGLTRRAREIAARLVGLPVEQAREVVAAEPDLTLRELAPDQAVTLEFRAGRVNAVVAGGVVTGGHAG